MSRRKKVNALAPNAEAEAKARIEEEQAKRAATCRAEIQNCLAEFRCEIAMARIDYSLPRPTEWHFDVVAQP